MAFKFRVPDRTLPQREYFYRCEKCSDAHWYVLRLPEHMLRCHGAIGVRGCGGRLVLDEEREVAVVPNA